MALDLSGLDKFSTLLDASPADASGVREIPIDQIDADPDQPRKVFDQGKLMELADSIKAHGVIQPVVLRSVGDRFQLIAGERRWRAAGLASLTSVPAIVRDDLTARAQMVENLQREDLSIFEIYRVIAAELDAGTSQKELSKAYGKGKSWISEYASVAKMPTELQDALREGRASDIYALSELNRLHKQAPEAAEKLASSGAPITRHLVNQLAETLARAATGAGGTPGADGASSDGPASLKQKKIAPGTPEVESDASTKTGVADNGEGLNIGGRGPSALPGSNDQGASDNDDYKQPQPLPNDLQVGIKVQYDSDVYWLRYDQQKQTDGKTLAMLATEAGLTMYAPLDELVIVAIHASHNK